MILISAVRYAVGRRTYIVGEAVGWIEKRWANLSPACKRVLLRDLKEEIERNERMPGSLGSDLDEAAWIRLHQWMLEQPGSKELV